MAQVTFLNSNVAAQDQRAMDEMIAKYQHEQKAKYDAQQRAAADARAAFAAEVQAARVRQVADKAAARCAHLLCIAHRSMCMPGTAVRGGRSARNARGQSAREARAANCGQAVARCDCLMPC
jgi:hypothetical protein